MQFNYERPYKKQQKVIDEALRVLKAEHGLSQVCLDQLLGDEDIDRDGIDEWVGTMVFDTCYHEGLWS